MYVVSCDREPRVVAELLQQKEAQLSAAARAPVSAARAADERARAASRHALVAGNLRDLDRIIHEVPFVLFFWTFTFYYNSYSYLNILCALHF